MAIDKIDTDGIKSHHIVINPGIEELQHTSARKQQLQQLNSKATGTKPVMPVMLNYRGQAVSAGDLVEMRTLVHDMIREQHLDKSVISGKQIFKDMLTYWLAAKSS